MYDVLVVGAGPTGLFMAIECVRRGLTVRIIDKSPAPSDKSRAIAVQARILEIFDQIGIVDLFLKKGLKLKAANAVSNKHVLAHIPFEHLDSQFPFVLSIAQYDTEGILTEHLCKLGVKIERGVELLSFEEKKTQVIAQLSTGKEEFSWMIGCDGAHSTTRKGLGLAFDGKTFVKNFALADVQVEWEYPHDEFFLFFNETGILVAVPLPEENRYRVIFQTEPTIEEAERLLKAYAGKDVSVSNPRWITNFTINSRITEKYFSKRIFLAGDAAHIHSPAGGQGMNTGFVDVYNLAWKIALVHQKRAKVDLLETYDTERRGFGKKLLKATETASNMAMLKNPLLVGVRNFVFSSLTKMDAVKKKMTEIISQIGIRYKPSMIVGPEGGSRAPNTKTESGDLYTFVRDHKGFIILSNQEKLEFPSVFTLTHDGSVYDNDQIYVIRPDTMIGCASKDPKVIRDYFSKIFIPKEKGE